MFLIHFCRKPCSSVQSVKVCRVFGFRQWHPSWSKHLCVLHSIFIPKLKFDISVGAVESCVSRTVFLVPSIECPLPVGCVQCFQNSYFLSWSRRTSVCVCVCDAYVWSMCLKAVTLRGSCASADQCVFVLLSFESGRSVFGWQQVCSPQLLASLCHMHI